MRLPNLRLHRVLHLIRWLLFWVPRYSTHYLNAEYALFGGKIKVINEQIESFKRAAKTTEGLLKETREKISERNERIKSIVERLAHYDWSHEHDGRYRLELSFDPRILEYGRDRFSVDILAREMAERVYHEILTSRFVESAASRQHESRRYEWLQHRFSDGQDLPR
jgi:hypothetical protein